MSNASDESVVANLKNVMSTLNQSNDNQLVFDLTSFNLTRIEPPQISNTVTSTVASNLITNGSGEQSQSN